MGRALNPAGGSTARPTPTKLHVASHRELFASIFGTVSLTVNEVTRGSVLVPLVPTSDALRIHVVERGTFYLPANALGRTGNEVPFARQSAFVSRDPLQLIVRAAPGSRLLTATAPGALLRDIPLDPRLVHVVPPLSALVVPAAAFLRSAAAVSATSSFSLYFFERLLQEMMLGLVVEAAGLRPASGKRNPVVFAMAIIAAQCADPDLTAASVAREVSVSQRQLERLFRIRGTSIAHQIRRARVDLATSLLRDPAYRALTVDQIAQHSGFGSGSSLARAMASQGSPSPSALRAEQAAIPRATSMPR